MIGFAFVFGFFLDLLIGDPEAMPHPVKLIGKAIACLERALRKFFKGYQAQKIAGLFLVIFIVLASYLSTWFIIVESTKIHIALGFAVSVLFCFFVLSTKCLALEATKIYRLLLKENIKEARHALSLIVGRDTAALNKSGVVRATVETVAENTVDGVIAPLFYLILGGPALGMAYKAVNTLDSMVGYKNNSYKHFGFAAAKIDDIANYIPARITGLIMIAASYITGMNWKNCFKTVLRDWQKNPSPNSGVAEAAVAGALGVQLGGSNYYQGKRYIKPLIGLPFVRLSPGHIQGAVTIMYTTAFLFLLTGIIARWFL